MSNISQMTTYSKLKQPTDRDSRNFGPLVSGYEMQTSTLNQTQITLTQFVCNLDRKSSIMVYIDGQLLTEGVGNDYVWTTGQNGTATVLTLAAAIPAGLNIQIYKIGMTQPTVPNAETIQATSNFALTQVDQKNTNRIINGAFDFFQRGATFVAAANNTYVADRWLYQKVGTMVHTCGRDTSTLPSGSTSANALVLNPTTAQASLGATDYVTIGQRMEGNILRSLKGKNIVIGFNVFAFKTGTYSICIRNNDNSRTLVKEFTVTASNTWERKYVRFTHDTTGTWLYDSGLGAQVIWVIAAGSSLRGTADVWGNLSYIASNNQVNGVDSTSNVFRLADVIMVEDNAANTKQPEYSYSGQNYAGELVMCQRYYEKSYPVDVNPGSVGLGGISTFGLYKTVNSGQFIDDTHFFYKVLKRTNPSVTIYSDTGVAGQINVAGAQRTATAAGTTITAFASQNTSGVSWTDGSFIQYAFVAESEL